MSEVEQNVVSVERILHYVKLEPEAPAEIPDAVPETWPSTGEVEFKWVDLYDSGLCLITYECCRDYSTRYRPELDLVLKAINIQVVCESGEFKYTAYLIVPSETQRKDWRRWTNWQWEVIGACSVCQMVGTWDSHTTIVYSFSSACSALSKPLLAPYMLMVWIYQKLACMTVSFSLSPSLGWFC